MSGDGSLLVVTHGGIVEAMAIGLSPELDFTQLGPVAGYAEGFAAGEQSSGAYGLTVFRL